jgi:hypoxanthine-guanine phosphoribosyltransferase
LRTDIIGIVHYEFVPTGQTVNQVYYLEVLKMLREKLDGKDLNFLPTIHGSCITTMQLLPWHSHQINVLEHTAYSPGLALNAFFLFPNMKEILKGRHFDDIDDISSEGHSTKPVPKSF